MCTSASVVVHTCLSRKSSDSREESGRAQKQRRGEGVDLCSAVQIVE